MIDTVIISIACDTAVQWDCNLPALFEQIERVRFMDTYVVPVIFLTYTTLVFFLPLWLLNRKQNK